MHLLLFFVRHDKYPPELYCLDHRHNLWNILIVSKSAYEVLGQQALLIIVLFLQSFFLKCSQCMGDHTNDATDIHWLANLIDAALL